MSVRAIIEIYNQRASIRNKTQIENKQQQIYKINKRRREKKKDKKQRFACNYLIISLYCFLETIFLIDDYYCYYIFIIITYFANAFLFLIFFLKYGWSLI
jgi:hypothetical protein